MRTRLVSWLVLALHGAAVFLLSSCGVKIDEKLPFRDALHAPVHFSEPPPARGQLRVSVYEAGGAPSAPRPDAPRLHRTTYVNGTRYSGMEDNDLRGYLDGVFKYAWNQPGQVHVRIGRRDTGPRFGEYEIFRVIHRWDAIDLPPEAAVRRAELVLGVEESAADTVRLMLYEVKKDWNPGAGGTLHNNVSPPVPGEVWWGELAADSAAWGLPGVGFASDAHPNADTGAMPLAEAIVPPGAQTATFSSPALAEYATRRTRAGAPLLFLLKLSDPLEDVPGTVIKVYSGNTGDSRNVARRPHLVLEWDAPGEVDAIDREIHAERGRAIALPEIARASGPRERWIAASFFSDSGSISPAIEVRAVAGGAAPGSAAPSSEWKRLDHPASIAGDAAEIRLLAALDPVTFGTPFQAELHDTWILNDAPENQNVPWTFVSPTGARHEVSAQYAGDFRWTVELVPDEVGTWTYSWSQAWAEHPFASGEATFDVVVENAVSAIAGIRALTDAASKHDFKKDPKAAAPFMARFARFERAAMLTQTPESFASAQGESLRSALHAARKAIGRESVPDSIPRVPDHPTEWMKALSKGK